MRIDDQFAADGFGQVDAATICHTHQVNQHISHFQCDGITCLIVERQTLLIAQPLKMLLQFSHFYAERHNQVFR